MDRNKVVEKFTNVLNGCIRVIEVKELVDALMECAIEETLNELDKQLNDLAERCEAIRKGETQE